MEDRSALAPDSAPHEGAPTTGVRPAEDASLRGWLSEVFVSALVNGQDAKLLKRLGDKAIVVEPLRGRSVGGEAVGRAVDELGAWLRSRGAQWTELRVSNGTDRDVTEGELVFNDGVIAPCAIVSERKRAREVEVKVYLAAEGLPEAALGEFPAAAEIYTNELAGRVLEWCRSEEATATAALFERTGFIQYGAVTARRDTPEFQAALEALGGLVLAPTGSAEDGRVFALQGVVTGEPESAAGRASLRFGPVLLTFERGDSGLLQALRVYGRLG